MFGLIIVGLSLVSMCINVVQLKLELLFEEMMLALMEEYEKTGQVIDSEMMIDSALFQRGLGVMQMMKLWKRKKRATSDTIPSAIGDYYLPLSNRKRRGAFLRELQRRRRARSVGTQTENWIAVSNDNLVENWPWMTSSLRRSQLKQFLFLHESTQTDPSDYAATVIVAVPSSHLDANWPLVGANCISTAPDQRAESARSASSSMVTCDDNNSVLVSCALTINEPEMDEVYVRNPGSVDRPELQTPFEDPEQAQSGSDIDNDNVEDETDESGSKSSTDLIPFIPYIEQEVPPEHEQEHTFRRWSAAEAMSVFANWAASRNLGQRRQSRQSRCSSDGDGLEDDEKLARFQNLKSLSGRRVTVAVSAPQAHSASSIRRKRLDFARNRAEGALSALRMHSREPSSNDIKAMATTPEKAKGIRQTLTAEDPVKRNLSREHTSFV